MRCTSSRSRASTRWWSRARTARPRPRAWWRRCCTAPGAIPRCSSAAFRSISTAASAKGRASTSSSRATSTTPPSSTRRRSSSTTARARWSITSVEFDHADIYRDLEHVKQAFRTLVARLPAGRDARGGARSRGRARRDRGCALPRGRLRARGARRRRSWRASGIDGRTREGTRFDVAARRARRGAACAVPLYRPRSTSRTRSPRSWPPSTRSACRSRRRRSALARLPRREAPAGAARRGARRRGDRRLRAPPHRRARDASTRCARATRAAAWSRSSSRARTPAGARSSSATTREAFDGADRGRDRGRPRHADLQRHRRGDASSSRRTSSPPTCARAGSRRDAIEGVAAIVDDARARRAAPGDVVLVMSNGDFGNLWQQLLEALRG